MDGHIVSSNVYHDTEKTRIKEIERYLTDSVFLRFAKIIKVNSPCYVVIRKDIDKLPDNLNKIIITLSYGDDDVKDKIYDEYKKAMEKAIDDAYQEGYETGSRESYENGYEDGYRDGVKQADEELSEMMRND